MGVEVGLGGGFREGLLLMSWGGWLERRKETMRNLEITGEMEWSNSKHLK